MRSLLQWNPYQDLTNWHRDIDDLFRRFFEEDNKQTNAAATSNWLPAIEVFERVGHYVIRADVPGIDPKEVELSIVNDSLILRGERKNPNEVKEKGYHYSETSYGKFERRLAIPKGVDPEKISAKFENGVLEISVPMPEAATARKVPIEVEMDTPKQIKAA